MNPEKLPAQTRLEDIAQVLGLSKSTVSLALRGSPKVKAQTAKRVREVAEQLHYRPDPLLSAFSSRRHKHLDGEYRATVAVIWPRHAHSNLHPQTLKAFQNMGYRMDVFYREDYPSAEHLGQVLRARGIPAVLLPESRDEPRMEGFPWEDFVAIQCGVGRIELPVDIIRYNPYDCVRLAWERFTALGCRRIGAIFPSHDRVKSVIEEKQLAAYLFYQQKSGVSAQSDCPRPLEGTVEECMPRVGEWLERERPDGVIGPWDGLYHIHELLLKPRENFRGYISVRTAEADPGVAGFLVQTKLLQLAALNHLHHRLRDLPSETGPVPRFSIVVEPTWKPGASLREDHPQIPG